MVYVLISFFALEMSVLNTGELYSKLLDDLKNLELELEG